MQCIVELHATGKIVRSPYSAAHTIWAGTIFLIQFQSRLSFCHLCVLAMAMAAVVCFITSTFFILLKQHCYSTLYMHNAHTIV